MILAHPDSTQTANGLSAEVAVERLRSEGPNDFASVKPSSLPRLILHVITEPMLLLLLAGGGIYIFLGDLREALTLLSFVFVVIAITLYQDRKTERALAALRELSSPRALVIRDGKQQRISGREVVREDLMVITEGDRVAADGILIAASNLQIDESLLTGESLPVSKVARTPADSEVPRPGGDGQPFVWAGSLVVRGHGICEVKATGRHAEFGRIGASLAEVTTERTPLEREIAGVVRTLAMIGFVLCLLLMCVYGLRNGDWLRGLLVALALAMAILPEELPVILNVFFALGAWRLSRHRVLTRRPPAIAALGAATVLCTDKTGTLTENRMRIARLWTDEAECVVGQGQESLPESVHELVEFGILASQLDPFDPMDRAFRALGDATLSGTEHLHTRWQLLREYPLSPELLSVSQVWRAATLPRLVIAAKGSPESIVDLCHLQNERATVIQKAAERLARDGLRVLGVARASLLGDALPTIQHDFEFEFLGLVGLADPLRTSVPAAIAECRTAGVRVILITGDRPDTAQAIARQAGLADQNALLTGPELDQLDDEALRERLRRTSIVARAVPSHKLRIVKALIKDGEIVAMTGDGVNDAPALKAAHIGVAMGGRGTDVAREAAGLVITDDDFASIVQGVRLGRRIFSNMQQAVAYVLAVHVPIIGAALLPVLLGWPVLLYPTEIVVLELLIDPACSMAFEAEPEEPGIMQHPPRKSQKGLLDAKTVFFGVLQGIGVLIFTLISYRYAARAGLSEGAARAISFAALLGGNVALIHTNRSWQSTVWSALKRRNIAAWMVTAGACAAFAISFGVPFLRRVFHFDFVEARWLICAAAGGLLSLVWFEVLKWLRPRILSSGPR